MDSVPQIEPSGQEQTKGQNLLNPRDRMPALICTAALLLFFSTNFIFSDSTSIFGLVPLYTVIGKSHFWNVVTSSFYEKNPFKLVIDILLLALTTKPFKILYSMEQFIMYFAISIILVALVTSAHTFFRFFVTRYIGNYHYF
jgi:hypothetical protein